ncbi:wax ester/triacylglycerol synthase family O-acyltransferase [Iamia sp. SCSIO 61187]|uniref:WS/DGAT/MGAT family O-acyltransferase n=1 Tax=Iamia sp. SCSIO 61187 TaxID=2722752 RepID=UPI001C625864|nr:wax ester/triacylglycerol synthase family O-acyltransferase [Iamia sp. SCSIO 61187]QYG94705.1 wax ester/triacylglycerol synthase family O-acyltransferase [Iamia sp. SCSIO 61187]
MDQLTGLDATFLYMESETQFGHVSGLSVFARPDDPGYDPLTAWRAEIERRLHLLEPLRRRVRDVPFRLDHPFWEDDPDFDLEYHVRHTAVAPPGSDQQLGELIARIIARPLDRRRPLWESYVIEGLPDDHFAILSKIHHATVDGASGAELLTLMLDSSPEGDAGDDPALGSWAPEPPRSDGAVLVTAAAGLVRKPGRALVLGARTARQIGAATRNPVLVAAANQLRSNLRGPLGTVLNIGRERHPVGEVAGPLPQGMAPHTPFNDRITAHRRFAFRSTSLTSVKEVKNALGATVNDVVMAMCAGGVRRWLEDHDALPDKALIAMVPVSIRTGEEEHRWTNRVSAIFSGLPTDEPDPLERVRKVHEAMAGAKGLFDAVPAEQLTDFTQFAPPAVFARAMRTALRLSGRFTPFNLVVSNVPGPRQPLYTAGAELLHYYPVSTVVDGQGLNVTVQSYRDTLDVGLVACRDLVPDLWDMVDNIVEELAVIGKAVGVDVEL